MIVLTALLIGLAATLFVLSLFEVVLGDGGTRLLALAYIAVYIVVFGTYQGILP